MAHYITLALNNIAVFSFPATANQQPTAGPSGTGEQQNSANPPNPSSPNGSEGVHGNGSASENDDNIGTQQPGSISSPPIQEEQGNGHTRTVNSYEHFVLKSR